MKKKGIYIAVFVVVIILGYFNYFGEEGEVAPNEQVVETTNVTYTNDDYVVEAEKQKDYLKENETGFEKARAKVNDMFISGDDVFIDKVRNLALKNNILGISPNGWKFNAQTADYNKLKDEIVSKTGVTATNEERGIKISGQNFLTDSKMSFIELEKDVVLENKDIALHGDKGSYNDLTKIVIVSDNITLEGRGENLNFVDGHFKTLKYNMDTRVLEAWEPFDATYKGIKLSAEKLYFKEDTEELKISQNVIIETNGFKIDVDRLEKKPNSEILNIYGKILGSNGEYSFSGDGGVYNTETKVLTISGNVKGSSTKGEKLSGDKLVYDTTSKVMILSAKENVYYSSKDGKLETASFTYNSDTKELETLGKYTFKGEKYESIGEKLYYNDLSKDMRVTKGYILDKEKKQRVEGEVIAHNSESKDTAVKGKARLEDREYLLSSEEIIYTGADKKAIISGNYTVNVKKDRTTFKGKDAQYNQDSGDFLSTGDVQLIGDRYKAFGSNLVYNSSTGFGKLQSKIEIVNSKDNIRVTGDNFSFQNGEYMEIIGNLTIESENLIAKSNRGKYNLKDSNIYFSELIDYTTKDSMTTGTMSSGVYDTKKAIFKGKNFKGKSGENNLTSNSMIYYTKEEKANFKGNVRIKNPETLFRGENVEYYPKSEVVKAITNYIIDYKDFKFKGKNGTFNNLTGILDGNGSDISSKTGDRFISDKIHGNLKEMIMDFQGNVKGYVTDNGTVTNFKGEFARIYFKNSGQYEILRSEVRENAVFIQAEKTLNSDYIEIDSIRNLVFSKENTVFTIEDEKNGKTVITSAVAEVDIDRDIATLIGNVRINNENTEYGLTKVKSDRGIIKQKQNSIELIGHVEIENKESLVQADRGIYNMDTKKIKASGNVYVDYKK